MSNIIQINNLNKSFGSVNAVQNLSFRVKKGELFAFLGINGAGKSTTINIMCGQLSKDSGSVFIDKHDLDKDMDYIKRELGVVFQSSVLDSALSVYDNLESRAALYGITGMEFKKRLEELAKILDFENLLKRTVGKLSGGQRRRIDIARALFHKPKILILDEPTTGLDPQTRRLIWNVISSFRKDENISSFGEGLQKIISFLPGTYGTSLIRNHTMQGALAEMQNQGIPTEVIEKLKDSLDCNLYFFGSQVNIGTMYMILGITILVLIGIYILLNKSKNITVNFVAANDYVCRRYG